MRAIKDEHIKIFSKKWNVTENMVTTIYYLINDSGRKYGRTSRILKTFAIELSPRQLKYFYRKLNFYIKFGIEAKGRPSNYTQMHNRNT